MFVPTSSGMSVMTISSCRHRDVSPVSCTLLLPFLAGIRTALYLYRLSQLWVGSTSSSLSGVGAVLSAVWFISEIVQSLLHEPVPTRLHGALPGIHRLIFIHHFPAQQWPLCKTISILSPLRALPLSRAAHTRTQGRGARGRARARQHLLHTLRDPDPCAFCRDRNGDREQL